MGSLANIALLKMARASARGISLPYFYPNFATRSGEGGGGGKSLVAKLVGGDQQAFLSLFSFYRTEKDLTSQGRNNKNRFGFGW
jgi:hypothetical protein